MPVSVKFHSVELVDKKINLVGVHDINVLDLPKYRVVPLHVENNCTVFLVKNAIDSNPASSVLNEPM